MPRARRDDYRQAGFKSYAGFLATKVFLPELAAKRRNGTFTTDDAQQVLNMIGAVRRMGSAEDVPKYIRAAKRAGVFFKP